MCNSLVPEQGSIIDVCVEGILMNVTGTHVRLQERAQAGSQSAAAKNGKLSGGESLT